MDYQKALDDGYKPEQVMAELSRRGVKMDYQRALSDGHDPMEVLKEMNGRDGSKPTKGTDTKPQDTASKIYTPALEGAGGIAGGIVGDIAGAGVGPWAPATIALGGGAGVTAGSKLAQLIDRMRGIAPPAGPPGKEALSTLKDTAGNTGMIAGIDTGANLLGKAVPPMYRGARNVISDFLGSRAAAAKTAATGAVDSAATPAVQGLLHKSAEADSGVQALQEMQAANRVKALSGADTAIQGQIGELSDTARLHTGQAGKFDKGREDILAALAKNKAPVKGESLHALGEQTRSEVLDTVDVINKDIEKTTTPLYEAAEAAGAKRGIYKVDGDLAPVLKDLEEFKRDVSGIPDLESVANNAITTIGGRKPAPSEGNIILDSKGRVRPSEPAEQGKNFKQLVLASRSLKNKAYGAELFGYDSIATRKMLDISKKIDNLLKETVPEYGVANDTFAKMKGDLDFMGSKLGKGLTKTEGGIQDDAFFKTASDKVSGKLFENKENYDTFVDILKRKYGDQKVAQDKADAYLTRHFAEIIRDKSAVGGSKLVNSPKVQGLLQDNKNVLSQLEKQIKTKSGLESSAVKLKADAASATSKAKGAASEADSLATDLRQARESEDPGKYHSALEKLGDKGSDQRRALTEMTRKKSTSEKEAAGLTKDSAKAKATAETLTNIIEGAKAKLDAGGKTNAEAAVKDFKRAITVLRSTKSITNDEAKLMEDMFNRATNLEDRKSLVRKLAGIGGTGLGIAAEETYRHWK